MRDFIRIKFEGTITLDAIELEAVSGDAVQAAQNALGFAGAQVTDAEVDDYLSDDYVPPDDPDDEPVDEP